ncbi:hypothetical protein O181_053414 [Austropuccinia psidii MF-1]|uniref:Uncharacterized protein n=1 Tax=Austropuccinia psidii MF-1 TaxID=1389203 RepID=A0A9Q3HSM4_9BASI|nr:hypothetical protein [Austropuccinia psidii MF-1]
MNQQSKSDLPPLPEDTVEGQYVEESEKEDQTVQRKSIMIQLKYILLTQRKKKGKRRPEDSPISPTPGPRATTTPVTEPRAQSIPRRVFINTPNNPSPLPQKASRQERPVVNIKAKHYNINFDGEEVERFIRKVERIAQIEGETDEYLAMKMAFWTTETRISDSIEAMPGYEERNWTQLKKDLMIKWVRVEPEGIYRKYSLIKLFNDTPEDGGIGSLSQYKKFMQEYEAIVIYVLR